jgi:signal transduction histidine kinase/FixJ family two-component response regulator
MEVCAQTNACSLMVIKVNSCENVSFASLPKNKYPCYYWDMNASQDRVLIVDDDPEISDLIGRQALKPLGYRVKIVYEAPLAIHEAIEFEPDVLIANLNLSGLSGKDLLVALSSQGLEMPVIVVAGEGMESDVIQAFRLGASDYITWPIREAEVVSAVERVLKQIRAKREREQLARKVKETNQKLQSRVRELTTILGIGKAVTSITDRHALFDKIIEGAVFVSEADKGWLLLREGDSKVFRLSAQRNLPKSIAQKIDQPWDDGISSLVALSGESLSIYGPPLKRFKVSQLGKSALVVPVKIKKEIVGLLVVVRDEPIPFNPSNKALLEALGDYASISLVNVSLYKAVEDRAHTLQKVAEASREKEKINTEILHRVYESLEKPLNLIAEEIEAIAGDEIGQLSARQNSRLQSIRANLTRSLQVVAGLKLLEKTNTPPTLVTVSLVDLARQGLSRLRAAAEENSVVFEVDFPTEPIFVLADVDLICQVFDALLSHAVQMSQNGKVFLWIQQGKYKKSHVYIKDSGPGLSKENQEKIFRPFNKVELKQTGDLVHLGIGLALSKEIIKAHGGDIRVESQLGQGSTFHFTLKSAN